MKYFLSILLTFSFLACSKTSSIPQEPTTVSTSSVGEEYLSTLNFKGKELMVVKIENQFYYVHTSGKKISTLTYDGQADEFSDGLARTKVNGKIGFFNKNLEIVLKPIYDFAFPFHNNEAEICTGCQETKTNGTSMLDGGRWKKINRDGLVIE